MPRTEEQARDKVVQLTPELDKRAKTFTGLEGYYTGECPLPEVIKRAEVTQAYKLMMGFAQTNYAKLIVKAATSRMQIGGIRSADENADKALWEVWQANHMDAESRRALDTVLTHGRVFALPWATRGQDMPQITMELPDTVIVEYREGSRYDRVCALRRWIDEDTKVPHATLYDDEAIYRFSGPKNTSGSGADTPWAPRDGVEFMETHPWRTVPAVEIATNRAVRAGRYGGRAVGDFEGSVGLLDRINVLEFLRLVIAFSQGFPVRVIIGQKIQKDDNGNAIQPFKLAADLLAQLENPNAKIHELQAADIKGFGEALDHDVLSLAGVCMTPAYFLRSVPIQNVSADTIRASDAPLQARIEDHKPNLSEGFEELLRVTGRMLPTPVDLPSGAEAVWINRESYSLAERADAAVKFMSAGLPWQFVGEHVLNLTQEEISRYEVGQAGNVLTALLQQNAGGGQAT